MADEGTVKQRRLRQMKVTATLLLLASGAAYVVSYWLPQGGTGVGFLRVGAEAAMVGGLADWFAVTALFRRPLGLPIPHTALIPTRKDALAQTLADFVSDFFFTPEGVRDYLTEANVIGQAGAWLVVPDNAAATARQIAEIGGGVLVHLDTGQLSKVLLTAVRLDMRHRSYPEQAGTLLHLVLDDGLHEPAVTFLCEQLADWLDREAEFAASSLQHMVERTGVLARLYLTRRRASRYVDQGAQTLRAVARDQAPELRDALDRLLRGVATSLGANDRFAQEVDAALTKFLADPRTHDWLTDQLDRTLELVREGLADEDSDLRRWMERELVRMGERAANDAAFRLRVNGLLDELVISRIRDHAQKLEGLITGTITKANGVETARKIELAVGRDLQFIRINGTLVGATAGIGIHALSLLLT